MSRSRELRCLDCGKYGDDVEWRTTPDRTDGKPFPRCEDCFEKRLDKAEETMNRYPVNAPADFDPMYAGERWNDD